MVINATIKLAKMLHVPVIHSSHTATFTGLNFPAGNKPQTVQLWARHKLLMKVEM